MNFLGLCNRHTENIEMLRSCVCMQRADRLKRRSSAADDTSSCGYSETEQIGAKGQHKAMNPSTSRSFGLKLLFPRKGWLKYFRKPQRGMSGTKAEKCECHKHIYMYFLTDYFTQISYITSNQSSHIHTKVVSSTSGSAGNEKTL